MFDQPTNAYLMEEEWLIGVKVERNSEGVLTGTELARCIELVMGEGAKASVVRKRAKALKGIAQEVADAGGHSEINLLDFVETFQAHDTACVKNAIEDRTNPRRSWSHHSTTIPLLSSSSRKNKSTSSAHPSLRTTHRMEARKAHLICWFTDMWEDEFIVPVEVVVVGDKSGCRLNPINSKRNPMFTSYFENYWHAESAYYASYWLAT
ncbi:hypothetical protein EJB05_50939, partial [Eragrostis curvula]